MKKEEAGKRFGNDIFYKLVNQNNGRIISISNNKQFIESEKSYWDKTLLVVYEKLTEINEIDFDTAYDLLLNNDLIIRRFYEHE